MLFVVVVAGIFIPTMIVGNPAVFAIQ